MRVVLDTNVLLTSIGRKSRFRPIFDTLINGKYELAITNEILSEYVEILSQKTTPQIARNISEFLINSPFVLKTEVFYKWDLIKVDFYDNKFVDCAIAANVLFVVSNDRHFEVLKNQEFPKLKVISAEEFLEYLTE